MAHSLSARKRVRQNANRRIRNRARKHEVKSEIKRFEQALEGGDVSAAKDQFKILTKQLDKVASTSTMHKKTAARKKSRLAKRLNALESKQS